MPHLSCCQQNSADIDADVKFVALGEGESGFVVRVEDFRNGADVGGRTEVQTEVVLHRQQHDLLGKTFKTSSSNIESFIICQCFYFSYPSPHPQFSLCPFTDYI